MRAREIPHAAAPRPPPPLRSSESRPSLRLWLWRRLADLTRKLDFDHDVDFVKASSYGASLTADEVTFNVKMKFDVKGRDIVLVDELVESAMRHDGTIRREFRT